MRRLKPTLCLFAVLAPLLGMPPVVTAAPEQFKLGTQVAAPEALPATATRNTAPAKNAAGTAKAGATKGKAAASSPSKPVSKATKRSGQVAAKSKARKKADVIANDIPPAKIDLSLPKDMVGQLQPPGQDAAAKIVTPAPPDEGKPLLPALFAPKEGAEPFQLNGRLLTNEMELQLRNENRREVEGAALDFKFKQ